MVIISRLNPAFPNKPPRPKELLTPHQKNLEGKIRGKNPQTPVIRFDKQYVIPVTIEVSKRRQSQQTLPENKFPIQSFAAVAPDVAVDLREPEGKV